MKTSPAVQSRTIFTLEQRRHRERHDERVTKENVEEKSKEFITEKMNTTLSLEPGKPSGQHCS